MILLYVYLAISAICWLTTILTAIEISHRFKKKYPELNVPQKSWAGRILTNIKLLIVSFVPLFNLALCWVYLFEYETIESQTMEKLYVTCMNEKEN